MVITLQGLEALYPTQGQRTVSAVVSLNKLTPGSSVAGTNEAARETFANDFSTVWLTRALIFPPLRAAPVRLSGLWFGQLAAVKDRAKLSMTY